jgi:hypothetical protein
VPERGLELQDLEQLQERDLEQLEQLERRALLERRQALLDLQHLAQPLS